MFAANRNRYALLAMIVLGLQATVAFALQSGSIVGKVRGKSGKSLPGVLASATRVDDSRKKVEATTGEKGEFEITGLAAGEYVIRFEKTGYRSFTSRNVKLDAGETMRLRNDIELVPDSPPYSMVRGAIFTGDGFGLPNAQVTIERVGEGKRLKRETVSVDGGEFTFKLPPEKATYRVTASARGFESASKDVEVDTDEVRQIALSLVRSK